MNRLIKAYVGPNVRRCCSGWGILDLASLPWGSHYVESDVEAENAPTSSLRSWSIEKHMLIYGSFSNVLFVVGVGRHFASND